MATVQKAHQSKTEAFCAFPSKMREETEHSPRARRQGKVFLRSMLSRLKTWRRSSKTFLQRFISYPSLGLAHLEDSKFLEEIVPHLMFISLNYNGFLQTQRLELDSKNSKIKKHF